MNLCLGHHQGKWFGMHLAKPETLQFKESLWKFLCLWCPVCFLSCQLNLDFHYCFDCPFAAHWLPKASYSWVSLSTFSTQFPPTWPLRSYREGSDSSWLASHAKGKEESPILRSHEKWSKHNNNCHSWRVSSFEERLDQRKRSFSPSVLTSISSKRCLLDVVLFEKIRLEISCIFFFEEQMLQRIHS